MLKNVSVFLLVILMLCLAVSCRSTGDSANRPAAVPPENLQNNHETETAADAAPDSTNLLDAQNNTKIETPADNTAPTHASSADELPPDAIRCEVKIQHKNEFYSAISGGLSIEEAIENTVDEACAVPCAASLADSHPKASDDILDGLIEKCADECADKAAIVECECAQNGQVIYTGGIFDEQAGNDADPSSNN